MGGHETGGTGAKLGICAPQLGPKLPLVFRGYTVKSLKAESFLFILMQNFNAS